MVFVLAMRAADRLLPRALERKAALRGRRNFVVSPASGRSGEELEETRIASPAAMVAVVVIDPEVSMIAPGRLL